jgi:hypothetical protein
MPSNESLCENCSISVNLCVKMGPWQPFSNRSDIFDESILKTKKAP